MKKVLNDFLPLTVLGMMSGTSIDGLDLALCDFWYDEEKYHYKIIQTKTFPYPPDLTQKLQRLFDGSALFFCEIEVTFSQFMAQCVQEFLETVKKRPDYIASHGHTVFHCPEKGLTKQIGSGAILAAKTGISVICDFRTGDVALGGQGAPLVPIGDALLFSEYEGCLNLGGIANISRHVNHISTAYDISLCNIPLNFLAAQRGVSFDNEGTLAKAGVVNLELLKAFNQPGYFSLSGAKSIGFEFFNEYYKPLLETVSSSVEDKLRTMCEHIAEQIAQHLIGLQNVLITGGGAKNRFLTNLIRTKCSASLVIPDNQLIDFKEAIIFAFLGYLRVHEINNCLQSVTGATKNSCSGAIYL